jgi:sugar O-acyltransferase (sialic acid O-acetyltransferase NeuD family)
MSNKLIGVFGASGFGREVMPLLRYQFLARDVKLVFVDDSPPAEMLNGYDVLSYTQFNERDAHEKSITIAIADSRIRKQLTQRCLTDGVKIIDISADNVVKYDGVDIEEGSILCSSVTITSNVKIGKSFHANIYSYVAHDCVIGDFVTFAPSVKCNGNVVIDDHAYIGAGAIIKQGRPDKPLSIGRGAVIGMGAVVTRDVPPGVTVIGNPARALAQH